MQQMNQLPKSQSDGPGHGAPGTIPTGVVALGTRVDVEMISELGDSERLTFDIVPDRGHFAAGFLGAGTPLARRSWAAPSGASCRTRSATWPRCMSWRSPSANAARPATRAEGRQAMTQEAVEGAKLDEMVQLALTVNVKWGDYDPEGILPHEDSAKV